MEKFLNDFAQVMVRINQDLDGHHNNNNQYRPGIGPYGEDHIVDKVMERLSEMDPQNYQDHSIRPNNGEKHRLGLSNYRGIAQGSAKPDLILNNRIIEFKIARPLRDNGTREDTWFKKIFEPNPDSYSTFIDVEKLCRFEGEPGRQPYEKWVVIIGFERINETEYVLDQLFPGLFQYISEEIRRRQILEFVTCTEVLGERHPYHQVVKLYAFRY